MEPAVAESSPCSLYPIALNSNSLRGVAAGGLIGDIYNGAKPGNFGWLTWTGNSSEPALAASLTPPGNSSTYINPNNPSDHEVSVGDWVRGKPGVSNSKDVRDALESLKTRDIIVPVWNEARGQGSNTLYQVEAFAQVRLLSYQLPGQSRISARFLGYTECPIPVNKAPQVNAGPDQTIKLPASASLNGSVTDDGLPRGSALTISWTKVSGPGNVTFSNTSRATTTAAFSMAGTYVLRLTASDSQLSGSDEVTITVKPANQPPVVNAGPDQTIILPDLAQLNGVATDDGLPAGSTLTTLWSQVSGPGSVTFNNPNSTATTAAFSTPGTYVLRLTASDSALMSSDELTVTVKSKPFSSRIYTLNADFDEGGAINVVHSIPDQLQLDDTTRAFGFIWVAVSTKGTVVKLNTETGAILGEYYTSPDGQPKDPSRTTVDHNGNVWATNRAGNSVVHIGLVENGQCVDRNGNGVIDTSRGLNDLRPWTNANGANTEGGVSTAEDECILHYTRVHSSGTRHVSVNADNDVWVSGTGGQIFDLLDGKTGLIKRTEGPVGYGGYGGLIDRFNVIWSARPLLRWDTSKPLAGPFGINWTGYGHDSYGLCIDSQGNVWNTSLEGNLIRKFRPDGVLIGSYQHGSYYAQGCVIDRNDHVWVAHSSTGPSNTVGHLKNDGTFVGNVQVGSGPTGVAADAAGKIWSTNYYDGTASRIDPNTGPIGADGATHVGAVDFTSVYLGGSPYDYSDMTGSTLTGAPDEGTWSTVFDSGIVGAEWGRIRWTARVCGDGALTVSLASSEDGTTFSPSEIVTNGADPAVANGRYLKITVSFQRATSGESPVLYDLSVGTQGFTLPAQVNSAPTVNAGADQTIALPETATLHGSVCDDDLPTGNHLTLSWEKVSGPGPVSFSNINSVSPTVTFSTPGVYVLRLIGSDAAYTSSDDVTITVTEGNHPPTVNAGPDQAIVLPAAANLNGMVNDDGLPNNSLNLNWSKVSGPGVVTFNNSNAAATSVTFSVVGYYVLRLTASDSQLSSSDDVVIKVFDPSATIPGGVFVTGHDPDFHAVDNGPGTNPNPIRARHIIQRAVAYVTFNKPNPRMLLVTDLRNPGSIDFIDSRLGLQAAGFTFDVADYGSGQQGALDLHTINFSNYDVIVVASDFGGWLRQDELDILNARRSEIINYINNRGGLVALAESGSIGSLTTHDRFGFLPFLVSQVSLDQEEIGNTVTAAGLALGLTNDDVNGNVFHNFFTSTGGMDIIDVDPSNRILSLATRGKHFDPGGLNNDAPIVSAGPDQSVSSPNDSATLNGLASDDGRPIGSTLSLLWSKVDGPGVVTFAHANQASTIASFSAAGHYVLRLTANDSQLSGSDDVVITVGGVNQPPVVNAGSDQTITLPNAAQLNGAATDDGLPVGSTLTTLWSQVNGPGVATFADVNKLSTTSAFSVAGTYVLRLTASDSQFSGSDEVTVMVNPSAAINQPPTVNAGPDQTFNFLGTASSKGNIVVNHDEWTISNRGFDSAPDAAQFVRNLARFFTGGRPGKFLVYSSNFGVMEEQFVSTMTGAGHTLTVSTSVDFTLPNLLQYDGIFLAADPVDNAVLINYVKAGGNVYLALGTGIGGPFAEAARWNTFLNAFDLNAKSEYNLISGVFSITSQHPIFAGVRNLFYGNGQSINRLRLSDPHAAVLESGFFGIYQTSAQVQLNGVVTDDGLPAGSELAISWSKVSGPGTVAFGNANAASTTAAFGEPGSYVLRLTADDSQLSRSDDVIITVNSPEVINQPPTVDAGPEQAVTLPNNATLSGAASDDGLPQGSSVTFQWSKVSGPGSVTFSSPNQPTSNAAFSAGGTYVLQLQASDTQLTSSDTVVINVNTDNQVPIVNAGPDQTIAFGDTATLSGTATDDGRPAGSTLSISWTKVSGPGTVTFGNASQPATTATFSAGGRYVLRLSANDSQLTSNDNITVTVNQAPTVNAGPDQTITLPSTATLNYTVTDDGLPAGHTTVTWSKVSGPGTVSFASAGESIVTATFGEAGTYVLRLSADDTHLTAADEVTVTVNPAEPPPSVSIISPADESELTTRADVIGSVSDGTWKLEYSLTGDEGSPTQWTTFAAGVGTVSNARLGVFDPTLLLNGRYLIRLSATRGGQTSSTFVQVVINKEQKVGNFTITFSDLSVPVAGLPIEVTRTYDSRDKRQGDFGVGWTLGVRNVRVQESRAAGAQWQGDLSGPAQFPTYCINPSKPHVVTITLADNRVYKFEATLSPGNGCQALAPLQEVTLGFRPLPGTNASLTPVGENPLLVQGPFPGAVQLLDSNTVAPVDYDQYLLTLENGTVLLIDQQAGLQRLTDTNGNTLTISPDGIIHSSGKSVTFTRDSQGRITQITDPAGNPMSYAYDANGDLTSFRDREGNVTTFTYNSTHGLLTINDPRGIQPLRNEYDAEGRLVKQIDAFGKEVRFTHDLNAQQEITFDRLGHATVYDYDAHGNVLRVQDADGKITTRTYDAHDNLLTETNALGKTTTYTYDAQDNRLSETDALNHTTLYTYNSRKQVLTVKDPAGGVTTYTYDANGNQTSVKDALGNTTSATYSANGLQLTSTDPLDNVTRFEYDASGNLIKQTDPLGNVTTYTYDADGNRLSESETRTVGGATETLTTAFQYDKLGRQTKVTYPDNSTIETIYNSIGKQIATIDQLSRRTSYEYDAMGRLVRTTYPDGTEEKSEYDFEGRRTKSIDRANRATTSVYDSLGRLEKITFPDASTTTNTYDAIGQVTATTDALNHVTRYEYDAAGRRAKVINALNNETVFGYDANGNQISVKDAKGNVTNYVYDADNRRTQVKFPDNTTQTTVYDNLGQVKVKTDQAGKQTSYNYDKRGKLTKVTDALGGITRYTYDEQGNQLTQTDANNHTTVYEYDRMGRRTKRTLPLGMSETYAYDLAGNLTSRTDFRGKTTTFLYDVMNRLQRKTPDASLAQSSVIFTYTSTGRRRSMTDSASSTTYLYDARDRLTSKAAPQGTLAYTYDPAGNLLNVRSSNANGISVNYAYDALNRLSTVNDQRLTAGTTSYTYDANGNLESTAYPNGVNTSYTYNALNRLTNLSTTKGTTLASYTYTLGAAGNRLSVIENGVRTVNYTYDSLYRLTGETITNDTATNGIVSYTYDTVGNRLSRNSTVPGVPSTTSTYDANDHLTSDSYDANGNTTNSGGNAYQYDFENRLISLNGGAATYTYDGDGNRVAKTIGGVTTQFLIDTNNPTGHAQVVEEIIGGNVQRTYTYGHDLISQNQLIGSNWTPSFYGYDGHGSTRYLTDTNGVITDTYTYDAFGNIIARTGSTPNDYLYSGEQFDSNIGFYYLRSRYYSESIGRFFTLDTFEGNLYDPRSLHKYSYVKNNPANGVDPSGKFGDFTLSSVLQTIAIQGVIQGTLAGSLTYALTGNITKALSSAAGGFIIGGATAGVSELVFAGRTLYAARAYAAFDDVVIDAPKIKFLLTEPGKVEGFEGLGYVLGKNEKQLENLIRSTRAFISEETKGEVAEYGIKYGVTKEIIGANGKRGSIEITWQVDYGTDVYKLVTGWAKVYK